MALSLICGHQWAIESNFDIENFKDAADCIQAWLFVLMLEVEDSGLANAGQFGELCLRQSTFFAMELDDLSQILES